MRKNRDLSTSIANLGLFVAGLLFLTNIPVYQFVVFNGAPPLYFSAVIILLAGILLFLRRRSFSVLIQDPVFLWFAAYAIVGVLWGITDPAFFAADNRAWRLRILTLLHFSAFFVIASCADLSKVPILFATCILFAIGTYWFDFLSPFVFVPQDVEGSNPGRAAGMFINANQAGNCLIIMGIVAFPFLSPTLRFLLFAGTLFGVIPTFSRAAIILAILVGLVWLLTGKLRKGPILIGLPLGVLMAASGFYLYSLGMTSDLINIDNILGRIEFFANFGGVDYSVLEREYVANLAMKKLSENPFLGIGTGATTMGSGFGEWSYHQSTHSMYLLLLAEHGVGGGLLYVAFLLIIVVRGYKIMRSGAQAGSESKAFGIAVMLVGAYFAFMGFFSHTLLEDPSNLFGLAILIAVSSKIEKATKLVQEH